MLLRICIAGVLCLTVLSTAWAEEALPRQARVFKVFDGDRLLVRSRNRSHRVQLADIDAPELDQPWGRRSLQVLEKMVRGKRVELQRVEETTGGDPRVRMRFGQYDISIEMLAAGAAWALPDAEPRLKAAEAAAREAGKGIWAPGELAPVPPWKWRAMQ